MKVYSLRKNHKSVYWHNYTQISGKVAFKTKEATWLDTDSPVVVLISVDSAFHSEIDGDLKIEALLAVIKKHVQGRIIVLMADGAHLHAEGLAAGYDAGAVLRASAEELVSRYRPFFQGCELVYWSSFIANDPDYPLIRKEIENLAQIDAEFQASLLTDAAATYTPEREKKCPNRALFIEKTRRDLLEQCVCMEILAKLGCQFLFYPGAPCLATEYAHRVLALSKVRLQWVDVFLSIEKKTKRQFQPCVDLLSPLTTPLSYYDLFAKLSWQRKWQVMLNSGPFSLNRKSR